MERRWPWQATIILFVAALTLNAQQAPAPTVLAARDLAPILDTLQGLAGSPVRFDRTRVEQGYMADVFTLVQNLHSLSSLLDLRQEATPTERQKLAEITDRLDQHFRALLARNEARLRNADRDNLARYADSDRVLPPPAAGEQRVLFMGDSITDGWKLAEYFPGKPYVNRGISGQITGEMLGRMKADALDVKPQAMVVLAGTNDLARGVAVQTVENNLYMIASLAKAQGIKVILASITPVNGANIAVRPPEKIIEINKYMQDLCAREGYVYLNYFDALKDGEGHIPKELAADGLHPNADGYKIMAPLVQAAIDKSLASSTVTSKKSAKADKH
jgi:lysophospholipase L1-like esterase